MKSHPIFVSLTTVDFRIGQMQPVLESILNQDLAADRVVLYVSKEPYMLDGGIEPDEIPSFIKSWEQAGKLEVQYTPNTGPFRKLIPILRENKNNDCVIITADDDTIYPSSWIKELYSSFRQRNTVVGKWGYSMKFVNGEIAPYTNWEDPSEEELLANFAIGKDGVLYSPKFFDDWIESDDFLTVCPLQDDVWFKFLTMRTGTGVHLERGLEMYPEASQSSKRFLWMINRKQNDPRIRLAMEYFGFEKDDFFV